MPSPLLLFGRIIYDVITPIFLMAAVGFVIQRKLGFDIKSLTRLNFWIFVPVFLFVHFVESTLTGKELVSIVIHFSAVLGIMYALTWWLAGVLGYTDRLRRAMTVSVLFYNSGNYGAPAIQLALGNGGLSVQAFIILLQNFTNFTIGLGLHAGGDGMSRRDQVGSMLKLPMIYMFVAAVIWRTFALPIPTPAYKALHYLADGMVPIALITLGAQMGTLSSYRITSAMAITLFLRLAFAPLIAFLVVYALHLSGLLAQAVIISTSFPTAVNSALLAIEYNNEPEYSSAVVFYSTLLSTITVPVVILAARAFVH